VRLSDFGAASHDSWLIKRDIGWMVGGGGGVSAVVSASYPTGTRGYFYEGKTAETWSYSFTST